MFAVALSLFAISATIVRAASGCPYADYQAGANKLQQIKAYGACRAALAKSATSQPNKLPPDFKGCDVKLYQQSCLQLLGLNLACTPNTFQNYGTYTTSYDQRNGSQTLYTEIKSACCSLCKNTDGCTAYQYMNGQRDVNCELLYSPYGDGYCDDAPGNFGDFEHANASPYGDTFEIGACTYTGPP